MRWIIVAMISCLYGCNTITGVNDFDYNLDGGMAPDSAVDTNSEDTTDSCLPESTITLSGNVTDAMARPIADVQVQWTPEDKFFEGTVFFSDGKGRFAFDCVPINRRGSLRFYHSDYQLSVLELITPSKDGVPISMPMVTPDRINKIFEAVGAVQDPEKATISFAVMSSGVVFHISTLDDKPVVDEKMFGPFYVSPLTFLPDTEQHETLSFPPYLAGMGVFLNVKPGTYKVWATHAEKKIAVAFRDEAGPLVITATPAMSSNVLFLSSSDTAELTD